MRKNTLLLLVLVFASVIALAQDTLYIYKGGVVVYKRAVVQTDSITFTAPSPFAGTFQDLDGNIYRTVTIGNQTWMAENLKTTKFRNGETIPNVTENSAWTGLITAAWCDYGNNPVNGNIFGHLYNWYAATDSRNIAPAGWHVPSEAEWSTLENYLINNRFNYDGTTLNNKIAKSIAANTYWKSSTTAGAPGNNLTSNNSTGFSALPGGGRYGVNTGEFFSLNVGSFWWSSTQFSDIEAWYKAIFYGYSFMGDYGDYKKYGYSIRCVKSDLPVIATTAATSITSTSVVSGGNITFDGNDPIISRGLCWNTTGNPTITDNKTNEGAGAGAFSSNITGLTPGTTYYLCSYATNSVGTAYGNAITFKTTATTPALTTVDATEITANSAKSGGVISNDGGASITARGVCWSTNPTPTVADSKTTDGTGPGTFSSNITGLTPGTTYYLCSYATNSVGTAYGNVITFKTTATIPTLTTLIATEITFNTAKSGGVISNDGGASITARGVCWSTNPTPTVANSKTTDGDGIGNFTSNMVELLPSTTYYVRAFATNTAGTAYGNEITFMTLQNP